MLAEARGSLGGRASYEEREGFQVDYGIHAHRFGKKGAAAAVYGALGEKLDLVKPDHGVVHYRGKSFPVPLKPRQFVTSRILPRHMEVAVGRALKGLLRASSEDTYDVPVADLLPPGTDKEVRDFISVITGLGLISQDLTATSAGELHWFVNKARRSMYHLMAFPRNGCRQHVQRLGRIIRESGEVRTGLKVKRVLVESGAAVGVETAEDTITAGAVVLAVPSPRAVGFVPEGVIQASTDVRMRNILPSAGLSWDVGLKRPVGDEHVAFSLDPLIIGAFPSNFDHLLCPPGLQFSTRCMPLPLGVFGDPDAVRRESAELRRKVFHMFPALEENIFWERMLKLPVIDGAVPLATQPWPRRPGPRVPGVDGLFLAGDTAWVPGEGGDIAFQPALECGPLVLEHLG